MEFLLLRDDIVHFMEAVLFETFDGCCNVTREVECCSIALLNERRSLRIWHLDNPSPVTYLGLCFAFDLL